MTPALRTALVLMLAIVAILAAILVHYGVLLNGPKGAWASVIIGIVALAFGLYSLFLFRRSKS